jgi:hypothetical protein
MPITVLNPFKGRQYPGEVILQAGMVVPAISVGLHACRRYWRSEDSKVLVQTS